MTVRIQGCVRTAASSDDHLYGLLTLLSGAWYFGYNVKTKEVQVTWVPSIAPLQSDPAVTSVLLRVWNISSDTLRKGPDTQALAVKPVLEKKIDLLKLEARGHTETLSLELNDYLVFGFEGTGPALGEQEDDGLSEKLLVVQTELEENKKQWAADVSSLREAFGTERENLQKEFDAEKARLQDDYEDQQVKLQWEMQEKTRDLEQRLNGTRAKLEQANHSRGQAERTSAAVKGVENALREEIRRVIQERDSIRVKLQELENEANTMSQALLDAKRVKDKQANPIAALKTESANFGPEFVVSEKHRRLNDDDNPARVVEMALKFEKMRTSEPKVRTSPFKNGDWRLCQDLQKLKDSLAQSETTRAQLVVENVRAVARLAELESEASKQQEQIQNLTQDFGGQKAAHEAALSEIDRLKGLMVKRSSSAETTIRDLRFKTEELEKRVESAAAEMNNLNKANSDSKDHVLREKTERQGVQNKVERPRPAINKPKIHVGVTEGHAPFGKPEPPEADSKLKDLQALLKDGSARYAKLLVDLKREKAKSAEIAGRLEAFETETKSTISKLTNNLEDVRAEAKGFSDSCDSIKVELEKTRSELAAANSESEKHAQELQLQTQGRLNAFKEAAKSTIAKFTDDIQDVRAGVKGNSDACDGTKTELEKTKQELERANTHCAKQADNTRIELEKIKRELQTANSPFTMRADSIKIELEKIRRELETANSQSAKQAQQPSTAAERTKELGGGKDALLEIIRIDHSAALSHLENEIRRLNEEIKGRDERIRQQTDSTAGLMKKLQHVLGLKAKLELKVQGLETEMAKLKAHVADEISSREHLEERLKSEALSHANTRQALANMTQRATTSSNQLSYANGQLSQQRNKLIQANGELEYEHNKARWVEAELNEKKNTLQELKTMVSNQRAKMRSLENASKHNNCVTKDTVEKVVGSYERLYDFAKRKGSRKSKKTVHKAHYPDSFGFADGKYFIKFRDEWF